MTEPHLIRRVHHPLQELGEEAMSEQVALTADCIVDDLSGIIEASESILRRPQKENRRGAQSRDGQERSCWPLLR